MRAKLNEKTVVLAFELCIEHLGRSMYHSTYPELLIRDYDCEGNDEYLGEFCPDHNKIYVFVKKHTSVRDLIRTVIHEYTHYLQPSDGTYDILRKSIVEAGGDYYSHPMEREARDNENKYIANFLLQINNKY